MKRTRNDTTDLLLIWKNDFPKSKKLQFPWMPRNKLEPHLGCGCFVFGISSCRQEIPHSQRQRCASQLLIKELKETMVHPMVATPPRPIQDDILREIEPSLGSRAPGVKLHHANHLGFAQVLCGGLHDGAESVVNVLRCEPCFRRKGPSPRHPQWNNSHRTTTWFFTSAGYCLTLAFEGRCFET